MHNISYPFDICKVYKNTSSSIYNFSFLILQVISIFFHTTNYCLYSFLLLFVFGLFLLIFAFLFITSFYQHILVQFFNFTQPFKLDMYIIDFKPLFFSIKEASKAIKCPLNIALLYQQIFPCDIFIIIWFKILKNFFNLTKIISYHWSALVFLIPEKAILKDLFRLLIFSLLIGQVQSITIFDWAQEGVGLLNLIGFNI
jgi:hypothetical protein